MNYWLLLAAPDKWFCDECIENARVNNVLKDMDIQPWRVQEKYFRDAKNGDKCIIKIGNDKRSIERRTLENGEVVDQLEPGIYALAEIIEELYLDEKNIHRIKIKVSDNLFKRNKIIDADMAEKILGQDYFSMYSKAIEETSYRNVESIITIDENTDFDDIEGDEGIEPNFSSDEESAIYPAEVNIQRDMYSVRELKTDFEDKLLILAPDFQREFVWKLKQKSELIESILMGIPLPMIYFFEGEDGIIQVVDGKQRLTSLFEFLDNKYPLSHSLSILRHLRGRKFKELTAAERTKIARHQFVTQTIIPPTPDKIKFDIFERVNRKGTTLNNQEMRNALYQGKSTSFLEKLAKNKFFKKATGNSVSPTRMKDRYMILRFLAFYLWKEKLLKDKDGNLVDYKSDIDEFLGKTMVYINHLNDNKIEELETIFSETMEISFKTRGKLGFRIPSNERKRPINMALMETLGYLFSKLRGTVSMDKEDINSKINSLFDDTSYLECITRRVDSSVSVKGRFDKIDYLLWELKND